VTRQVRRQRRCSYHVFKAPDSGESARDFGDSPQTIAAGHQIR
jgi:hypothetical protein